MELQRQKVTQHICLTKPTVHLILLTLNIYYILIYKEYYNVYMELYMTLTVLVESWEPFVKL